MTTPRRGLYPHDALLPLVRPHSVAVVGASETRESFGTLALRRLTEAGFTGGLFAVRPKAEPGRSMLGVPMVPTLREIDGGVDCVLVAVPAAAAEAVVQDAAHAGCRSAIIFSAGLGESGDAGKTTEQRILGAARAQDMRLGGPNTAGIINYRDGIPLTFVSDLAMDLPVGNIGIVSQSGGLATHLGHVRHRGIGISYTITAGNSVDVTVLDYVRFLIDDEGTDVIALIMEGLPDPVGFAEVGALAAEAGKPIVMVKCGRTEAGRKAAVSHTGSLVGSHDVFLAAARQAGIMVVDTTEEMIETATLFAKWARQPYRDGGVAVITTMGGAGVMAADAAADASVGLPAPSARTVERLAKLIPSFAVADNPIDTTASPPDAVLAEVITTAGEDPRYAATVVLAASMTGPSTAGRPGAIAAAGERMATPLAAVWLSSWAEGPGTEVLDLDPRIPLFRSSGRCMRAIARWMHWHEQLRTGAGLASPAAARQLSEVQQHQVRGLVEKFASAAAGPLGEAQSRELLAATGIEVPRATVVASAEAAAKAAAATGFPVVAKVISADVPHKAAVGGVVLGVRTAQQAADAYERIMVSVTAARPDAAIDGVLIAEDLDARVEFMCGLIRDLIFGPVVVCGAGGGAAEQINDVAHAVMPVTQATARSAVRRLRIFDRLQRTDPAGAVQTEAGLTAVMTRLAALAITAPEVQEIDVNPVVVRDDGSAAALDGLVVLAGSWRDR